VKKLSIALLSILFVIFSFSLIFADTEEVSEGNTLVVSEENEDTSKEETKKEETKKKDSNEDALDDRMGNASKTTISNVTSKDEKIKKYTEQLGGNKTNGTVLYYLWEIQRYSIPVCFVGLVIASLNFFIIGNKKLEKRESGFRMLVTLIVGLIVFQVLPLLFAIIVAGR